MPNSADAFLADVVNDIVTRAEKYMAKNHYDRERHHILNAAPLLFLWPFIIQTINMTIYYR
ncbi:unnamed protein product [Leptidea sinapis]|uniref:Uncharacterized protein n=1 Tax=Leptidea sinapis TaxID=189913 RepID=A0A5E4PUJ7_9NEOP|nr:unnamed protein product [Leptidea sinapis]